MKTVLGMVLASVILVGNANAGDYVSLYKKPSNGCAPLQASLEKQVGDYIQKHSIDGRYTVVVTRPEIPLTGCRLQVALQDSHFELVRKLDTTAYTFRQGQRDHLLGELMTEVQNRPGYVLHEVTEEAAEVAVKFRYEIESLYIVPKIQN